MEGRFNKKIISFVLLVVLLAELVVLGYFYYLFQKEVAQNAIALEAKISDLEDQNMFLADALYKEQQKNSEFASQIKQIAGKLAN